MPEDKKSDKLDLLSNDKAIDIFDLVDFPKEEDYNRAPRIASREARYAAVMKYHDRIEKTGSTELTVNKIKFTPELTTKFAYLESDAYSTYLHGQDYMAYLHLNVNGEKQLVSFHYTNSLKSTKNMLFGLNEGNMVEVKCNKNNVVSVNIDGTLYDVM